MKRLIFSALAATAILAISACTPEPRKKRDDGGFRQPAVEEATPKPPEETTTTETTTTDPVTDPAVGTPDKPKPPVVQAELPYGKPVDGKPGLVTSPYAPAAGYVDVKGLPAGTEVKCPYTGKSFLVP